MGSSSSAEAKDASASGSAPSGFGVRVRRRWLRTRSTLAHAQPIDAAPRSTFCSSRQVSPGLLNAANTEREASESSSNQELNELLQRAYQMGVDSVVQQQVCALLLMQALAAVTMLTPAVARAQAQQQDSQRQDSLEAQARANAAQERELRSRIDALQAREYRAPKMPMSCKEQRQEVLLCYQTMRGAPPGEVVHKCQTAVDDLERCATLVREAALAKIASTP